MSPLSPPSSLASLSPHSAVLPPARPRPRRHHSHLDLPPGVTDDVLAPAANNSPSSATVSATPNSHVSSDNDPSTDGSRSIPNVDLHTLAHLLSPASNRPAPARRPHAHAKPPPPPPLPAPPSLFRPIALRADDESAVSHASYSPLPAARPALARPRPTRPDDAAPLLRAAASRISWHRARTDLAHTLQHSPALSDDLCNDADDEEGSFELSDEDREHATDTDDDTVCSDVERGTATDARARHLVRQDTADATDFRPQHARVTLDAQTLQRDVSHIRHARRNHPRATAPAPSSEFAHPSRRHRSDGVVAAWRCGSTERVAGAGAADRAREGANEGRMGACAVQAVNGAAPTSAQKSGAASQTHAAWPSTLSPVPTVRAHQRQTTQPTEQGRRRRRRSSHLAGALRRKVSSVWATGAVRAASTTATLLAGSDTRAPLASSGTDDARRKDPSNAAFVPVEHGECVDDDEDTDECIMEECSGSGHGSASCGDSRTESGNGNMPRQRMRTRSGDVRAAGASPGTRASGHPVHPYAALAPFGLSPAGDAIVLYTNSVRAEVNDLIFLASLLRRSCGADGAAVRKRHRSLDVDFELWFTRFAQYCGLVLFGIEELVMRAVAEVLGQRDVMLSRAAAAAEAGGSAASRAAAWNAASRSLYARMDAVRDGLNDVASAVVWLRRARALREDPAQAAQRAVAGVRRLAPAALALMDEVDARVGEALALRADWSRALRALYRQFAAVLAREGAAPLGWGAVVTLTRWIADRRLRAEHVKAVARAARLGMFARFKGDCSHQAIVRVHQTLAADEDTRRVRFFV